MLKRTISALVAMVLPCILASCKADADIDASFQTTVNLYALEGNKIYENRIKFSLIDMIRPSLEKLSISPEGISISGFTVKPNLVDEAEALKDLPVDMLIFIELVRSETDIVAENRTLLCAAYGTTPRNMGVLQPNSAGTELLKQILADETAIPAQDKLKHVLLTYQMIVNSNLSSCRSIDINFTVKAKMSKSFENIL